MRKAFLIMVMGMATVVLNIACAHSTVMVRQPYQEVHVSGRGTNVQTVDVLGKYYVFDVKINTILDTTSNMLSQYPGTRIEMSPNGLQITGGGRINPSSPNQAQQVSANGKLMISNLSKVKLPVSIYNDNFRTRTIVKARGSTTLTLPAGKYTMQIADSRNAQEIVITAGETVEATINLRN
ncbi:MAG: hypothetical protein NTX00_00765 [Candidatus Parcubacteria bacterium]|nr:hypothetical protein [Candidatus Parcubacteria bacterium]